MAGIGVNIYAIDIGGDDDLTITPKGYGALEAGQIAYGYYKKGTSPAIAVRHIWQERAFVNFGFDVQYKEHLKMDFAGEGMMAFSVPQLSTAITTTKPHYYFYIKRSNATIMLGNPERIYNELQIGFFPFKYNENVRNLGEYMFRTNPYPLIFYSDFDYPLADLVGLRWNIQGFGSLFSNNLMLHSDIISFPTQNWSISDIAEVNLFKKSLSVGGGLSFHHLLNVYQGKNISASNENFYYPENLTSSTYNERFGDAMDNHRATKLMCRGALDIPQLIAQIANNGDPLPHFNPNDGRIYAEIDIIGTKNFAPDYNDKAERTIYSFGFNIPGLFIIDLINFEFEYCKNRTALSEELFFGGSRPTWNAPRFGLDENNDSLFMYPWRRSIYLKKTLFDEHLGFILQIARDHKKINFHYWDKSEMSFRPALPKKEHWWWTLKAEYKF